MTSSTEVSFNPWMRCPNVRRNQAVGRTGMGKLNAMRWGRSPSFCWTRRCSQGAVRDCQASAKTSTPRMKGIEAQMNQPTLAFTWARYIQ